MSVLHPVNGEPPTITQIANNAVLTLANRTVIPLLITVLVSAGGWQATRALNKLDDQNTRLTRVEDGLNGHTASIDRIGDVLKSIESKQDKADSVRTEITDSIIKLGGDIAGNHTEMLLRFKGVDDQNNTIMRRMDDGRADRSRQVEAINTRLKTVEEDARTAKNTLQILSERLDGDEDHHVRMH